MDLDEFRVMLSKSKVGVWALIDTAITVASLDYGEELRDRRDKIVEKLYLASSAPTVYRSYGNDVGEEHDQEQLLQRKRSPSPLLTPESNHRNDDEHENNEDEEEDLDPFGGLFEEEDEQTRIFELKERLEDLDQSEESIIELLQSLADMEITFPVLQSSEIGRHVSKFKRHRSSKVRDLVKLLVSKWKETVDEWVKLHPDANLSANEDSPQQNVRGKAKQNGQHQGSDFAYSPNPYGGSSSERNYSEIERKPKPAPPREAPPRRPPQYAPKSVSAPPANRQKESTIDLEKLNSARKRLQENYQEAQNAKKQRTIQVMDIRELPKPKNAFFSKNKGGFQGRHHR